MTFLIFKKRMNLASKFSNTSGILHATYSVFYFFLKKIS